MKPFHHSDEMFLALLRRWISGDINRREEAELGRLAAADDFMREAFEGLRSAPEADHAARLSLLEARLKLRSNGGRTVPLWPRLLAAAAVLALVAVAVWFLPEPFQKESASSAALDNRAAPDTLLSFPETRPQAEEPEKPGPIAQLNRGAAKASAAGENPVRHGPPDTEADATAMEIQDEMAAAPPPEETLSGASRSESRKEIADDKSREATMKSEQPVQPGVYDAGPAAANNAIPRKKAAKDTAVLPAGGWDAFRNYLNANARLTDAARNNNISGFVRLKFSIDTSGFPVGIEFIHRLGYGCDEEAERLVKQYRFSGPSNRPTEVDVWFRR